MRTSLVFAVVLIGSLVAWAQPESAPATLPTTVPTTMPLVEAPALPATQPASRAVPLAGTKAVVVQVNGAIDDFTTLHLKKRFEEAKKHGAKVIVVSMNTPGGGVGAALDISRFLRSQDDVYVVAYVDEEAYSAGSLISVACDQIVMQRGAFIGDCAPIAIGNDGGLMEIKGAERAKMESPILADFYASATRNGHDPLMLESMVAYTRVVHYLQSPGGENRFVSGENSNKLKSEGWTTVSGVPDPLDGPDSLLTIDSEIAQRVGLSRGSYSSVEEFLSEQGWPLQATLVPTAGEKLVAFLGSSAVQGIMMTVFLLSLYLSFNTPGHGAPEAVAMISLAMIVGVPMMTGHASWLELVLILGGVALLAVELFIVPGVGFFGLGGAGMLLLGLLLTFVPAEPVEMPGVLPQLPQTWDALKRGIITMSIALTVSILLWLWISRYIKSVPYFNRMILAETSGSVTSNEEPAAIGWPAVGAIGKAVSDLRPGGQASFFDVATADARLADVVSESGFVRAGEDVIVKHVDGNRVAVKTA